MSFVDHPPDWLEEVGEGFREFLGLEAGAPRPKANQQKQDDARGLVLPGYKYLGPGNGLDKGEPVNFADSVAREHDLAYNQQLEAGDNPYLKYNHADAEFQEKLAQDTSFGGNLGKAVFQAKKRLLEPLGLVEPPVKTAPTGKDRIDDHFPKRKKARVDDGEKPSGSGSVNSEAGSSGESSLNFQIPAPSTSNLGSDSMSAGGGAPMGDDQQGADGVGNASGDWHCDSVWMGDRVVTKSTRTWVLPSYNNHVYREITSTGEGDLTGSAYFGYSTPWGYFDFNRFHCHWSPRDWQRLINNHWGFRPKSLHVKVFNIQVKEVTVQDQTTTIANNLTSTIQIFADSEYQLPYVCGNATEGCLPAFPPQVFTLPQYGYATLNDPSAVERRPYPTSRSSFFCLEYFPSKMLRTGNNFEFTFNFEEVPFHTGFAPNQHIFKLANPLVDQYLYRAVSTTADGTVQFKKMTKGTYGTQYRNWFPGGGHARMQGYDLNVPGNNAKNQNLLGAANLIFMSSNEYDSAPGPNGMTNKKQGVNAIAIDNTMIFNNQPSAPGSTSLLPANNLLITQEDETEPVNVYAGDPYGDYANNVQNANTNPVKARENDHAIWPGSVWMNRDVYLQGPIWAKIPDTGAHFHPNPAMGGFGYKKPPPMLLIKNTPVPGNVTTFSDIPVNSFITQYSTGQVTVQIEWELLKENSKRWNPEMQYTNNYNNPTFVDFAPDTNGEYRTTRPIGTRYLTRPL